MPYSKSSPPSFIKSLPSGAKTIWVSAFNAALKHYKNEQKARRVAWAAVKTKYRKSNDGKWVAK